MNDPIGNAAAHVAYWEWVASREPKDSPRAEFIARHLKRAHAYYDRLVEWRGIA